MVIREHDDVLGGKGHGPYPPLADRQLLLLRILVLMAGHYYLRQALRKIGVMFRPWDANRKSVPESGMPFATAGEILERQNHVAVAHVAQVDVVSL